MIEIKSCNVTALAEEELLLMLSCLQRKATTDSLLLQCLMALSASVGCTKPGHIAKLHHAVPGLLAVHDLTRQMCTRKSREPGYVDMYCTMVGRVPVSAC